MSTTNRIAELWKPVLSVSDLSEGERFWSAMTGKTPTGRHGDENGDTYSTLEDLDGGEDTDPNWFREIRRPALVEPTSTSGWMTWLLPCAELRRSAARP